MLNEDAPKSATRDWADVLTARTAVSAAQALIEPMSSHLLDCDVIPRGVENVLIERAVGPLPCTHRLEPKSVARTLARVGDIGTIHTGLEERHRGDGVPLVIGAMLSHLCHEVVGDIEDRGHAPLDERGGLPSEDVVREGCRVGQRLPLGPRLEIEDRDLAHLETSDQSYRRPRRSSHERTVGRSVSTT